MGPQYEGIGSTVGCLEHLFHNLSASWNLNGLVQVGMSIFWLRAAW